MLGRPVKIKPGVVKSASERSQQRSGDSSPRGEKTSLFGGDRWRRNETASFAKVNSDSSRRLYVGGLPRLTDHEALSININNFFQDFQVYVLVLYIGGCVIRLFFFFFLTHILFGIIVKALASCLPHTPRSDSNPVTTTTSSSTSAAKMRPRQQWVL